MHHILLVDDDAALRELTCKYLQRNGYRVSIANDGWEAIREIVVNKPSVVLMDIEMPKLSGLNALDILRVSRLTENLPVIVTSAHGDKDTILRAVQLGADDFIVKPYSFSELTNRIQVQLFVLDYALLKITLQLLAKPAPTEEVVRWTGLDTSRYQDWGAFPCVLEERELVVFLQKGLTLTQAIALDETEAGRQIMVLAKFRNAWKCVWPVQIPSAQSTPNSATSGK